MVDKNIYLLLNNIASHLLGGQGKGEHYFTGCTKGQEIQEK